MEKRQSTLIRTLLGILKDNHAWRKQIGHLAVFELKKKQRGAVLGWVWFFIKPAMYIFCFWFALEVGLRASHIVEGAPPYVLWLSAGLIPWFFMQEMLGTGINVLKRYPYLVNKIKFPLSGISSIYTSATMLVQFMLQAALLVVYFACGMKLDVYLLQVPLLLLLMFLFWDIFSIFVSQLSAISKDVANLMKALSTPFFWLSGVIFNVKSISIGWIQTALQYNPITFFVTAFRDAYYDKVWFWQDAHALFGFVIVFLATLLMMLFVYKRFNEEVADVF